MKKLLSSLEWLIVAPLFLLHELCHYLAARLLGFPARLHLAQTVFYPPAVDWRVYVVLFAPSLLGVLVLALMVYAALVERSPLPLGVGVGFNLLWQATAGRDFFCAWHLRKHGTWPPNEIGPREVSDLLPWKARNP